MGVGGVGGGAGEGDGGSNGGGDCGLIDGGGGEGADTSSWLVATEVAPPTATLSAADSSALVEEVSKVAAAWAACAVGSPTWTVTTTLPELMFVTTTSLRSTPSKLARADRKDATSKAGRS
jgi:hypothetical protein